MDLVVYKTLNKNFYYLYQGDKYLLKKVLSWGTSIPPKRLLAITLLNSSLLAWYFFLAQTKNFEIILQNASDLPELVFSGIAIFYFFGVVSAIIGSSLALKYDNRKLIIILTAYGVLSSFFIFLLQDAFSILFFSSALGVSLGLVYPVSMAMMANFTEVGERGKVCALYILQTFIMLALAIIIQEIFVLGVLGTVILLILIRLTGFFAFVLDDLQIPEDILEDKNKKPESWSSIISFRMFYLYFIPWFLFLIVIVVAEYILWPSFLINEEIVAAFSAAEPLQYITSGICSVLSGFLADRRGRKIPIMLGLITLAISFALLSVSVSPITVFLHILSIGIAFGFIMVIYTAVPADLSFPESRERYYALIVVLPLSAYGALGAIPAIFGIILPADFLAPILGIIILLSIYPIERAKELLPSKEEFKNHLDKLGELRKESD